MYVSFSSGLDDGRPLTAIGRIKAATRWRAAGDPGAEVDRQAAIEALTREAEEYGADAVVDVRFEVDWVQGLRRRGRRPSASDRDRACGAIRARGLKNRLRSAAPRANQAIEHPGSTRDDAQLTPSRPSRAIRGAG